MNNSKTYQPINKEEEEQSTAEVDDEEARADWFLDFHWLTEDVAIGGSFPSERSNELAVWHGFRAVVDLRAEQCDDEVALRAAGIELLHLPTPDLDPATQEHLDIGVTFVRRHVERDGKVLIHCQHGIGRSALLGLCVLVDQGWKPMDALLRAKNRREIVSPSRSQYEGWAAWLRSRNVTPPDYHEFGCIAYRHLAGA